jgi:flavin-binding protein dodecin
MNQTRSIELARSSSLKGSVAAMARAADQARRTAAQTRTAVVVERDGVLEFLHIAASYAVADTVSVAEPLAKDR